jgi:uncharacterized protein
MLGVILKGLTDTASAEGIPTAFGSPGVLERARRDAATAGGAVGGHMAAEIRQALDHANEDIWLDLLGRMSGSPQPGGAASETTLDYAFPDPIARPTRSRRDRRPFMVELTDNVALHRFEMEVDCETASVYYALQNDRLVLLHTEVPQALAGRGIGTALARAVLAEARRRGRRILPRCDFIAAFIRRNPEYSDLIAEPGPDGVR